MNSSETRKHESMNEQYERELKEQRDKLIAESDPAHAWMIETAYQITRNPYRRRSKKGRI